MLPLFDKSAEVAEVLVPAVLVVLDLLLALFVPLVCLDELADVLRSGFDSQVGLSLLLNRLELLGGLCELSVSGTALRSNVLSLLWLLFVASGGLVLRLWLRLVLHGRVRFHELLQHVVCGQTLNHGHELFHLCSDSLPI